MGKGEIACYEQFLLFPQSFQKDLYSRHIKTQAGFWSDSSIWGSLKLNFYDYGNRLKNWERSRFWVLLFMFDKYNLSISVTSSSSRLLNLYHMIKKIKIASKGMQVTSQGTQLHKFWEPCFPV